MQTDNTTRHEIARRALRGLIGVCVVMLHLVTAAALVCAQDREVPDPADADAEETTRAGLPSTPYQAVFDLGTTQLEAPAAALLPDALQLEASSVETPWTLVGLQPRVEPSTGDDVGRFVLTWRRTVSGVTHWLDLRDEFGQKTASPPVFGRTDLLNISGSEVWVNVVDSEQRSPLHFGPYLQGWKSFRSTFDGHYGVQLRMSW